MEMLPPTQENQLWEAARDGKDGEIERLIEAGTNVNCAHPGRSDTTPLMTAARYANLSSVKLLVRYGADVNMKSRWGRTALDDARKYNKQPRVMDKRRVEKGGKITQDGEAGHAREKAQRRRNKDCLSTAASVTHTHRETHTDAHRRTSGCAQGPMIVQTQEV